MRILLALASALTLSASVFGAYPIEEVMVENVPTLVKKATVKSPDAGSELAKILPSVAAWIAKKSILTTGAPFARYHKYDPKGDTVLEAGFPAITAQPLEEGIEQSSLPGGRTLTTRHHGPYDSIGPAYEALHVYMEKAHLVGNGGPWEVYLNDPTTVTPDQITTQIYYPVKN